jgi:hypothetical protein
MPSSVAVFVIARVIMTLPDTGAAACPTCNFSSGRFAMISRTGRCPAFSEEGRAALCWLLYREGGSAIDDTGPIALIRMDGLMASAVSPSGPVDLYHHFSAGKRRIWKTEQILQEIIESAFSS